LVFASGVLNVSTLSFLGAPGMDELDSPGTTVFVDPAYYFKDYSLLPEGSTFTVYINISEVSDLYTWQVNMTWNRALLNVTSIIASEFLARSPNVTSSEVLDTVINATDNAVGTVGISETILGNIVGVNEPVGGGTGRLVAVQFKVVGYGSCDLVIRTTGNLATSLLTSTGTTITYTPTNGYFSNKATGDIDGDRDIDGVDFGIFAPSYGSLRGQPAYNEECDLDHDGDIDGVDFGLFAPNYGRSV
jgi:hypothetical protein